MAAPSLQRIRRAVLVVDDDGHGRAAVQQVLASQGYRVLTAASGLEALALLCEHGDQIGLAVIDVLMPGADGPTVLDGLRQRLPGLAACLVGSPACGYSRDELAARGATVLNKPLHRDSLLKTVARLLP
jgi:two-component system cell cycle sensor histidine kinase/response regulator CckA